MGIEDDQKGTRSEQVEEVQAYDFVLWPTALLSLQPHQELSFLREATQMQTTHTAPESTLLLENIYISVRKIGTNLFISSLSNILYWNVPEEEK